MRERKRDECAPARMPEEVVVGSPFATGVNTVARLRRFLLLGELSLDPTGEKRPLARSYGAGKASSRSTLE